MVNQESIVIWSHPVRGDVACPAPGQDYGAFEVLSVLTKFVRLATSRSHLFCDYCIKQISKRVTRATRANHRTTASLLFYLFGQVVRPENVGRTRLALY